jgi:hypothetical protein
MSICSSWFVLELFRSPRSLNPGWPSRRRPSDQWYFPFRFFNAKVVDARQSPLHHTVLESNYRAALGHRAKGRAQSLPNKILLETAVTPGMGKPYLTSARWTEYTESANTPAPSRSRGCARRIGSLARQSLPSLFRQSPTVAVVLLPSRARPVSRQLFVSREGFIPEQILQPPATTKAERRIENEKRHEEVDGRGNIPDDC